MKTRKAAFAATILLASLAAATQAQRPLFSDQKPPLADIEEYARIEAESRVDTKGAKALTPRISNDFIVFGYVQSYTSLLDQIDHARWQSLTHVGTPFVEFDVDGHLINPSQFTGRSATLQAGGAAQNAGVKVIAVLLNNGFDSSIISGVMTNATARTTLVSEVAALVNGDGYCAGVSFDFEPFTWNAATRDGMTIFFQQLRTALPGKELSIYVDPNSSTTRWDIPGLEPNVDYLLYSGYDYATGDTAHAITDHNSSIAGMRFFLEQGLPSHKLVSLISAYSRKWSGITSYNQTGTQVTSTGFTDALYDTTVNPLYGGPYANTHVRGDEVGWYTYNNGTTDYVVTWDSPEAMEYKVRHALSFQDTTGAYNGVRLGGVGFWSTMWMGETGSWDMNTDTDAGGRTITYPQIYQICQKTLAKPGEESMLIDGFEYIIPRWRDPNTSPDTVGDTDSNSARTLVTKPAGAGAPADSTKAVEVVFDFENASGNRLFFRHEVLARNGTGLHNTPDTNGVVAKFDASTAITAAIHTPASYATYTLRMVVMDKDRELEASPTFTLGATGWRNISWDLTNPANITAYNTNEAAFLDGDGVLDTAGDGAEDISFIGFLIEGSGATTLSTKVTIDELAYTNAVPAALNFKINEFRYAGSAGEFVEIQGPAGAIPAGTELRFYDSSDATYTSVSLAGAVVPASGLLVVGDPAVPNVGLSTGFADATDNIPDVAPTGIQIYNATTGYTIDSAVYLAFGGLGDLIRTQAKGVVDEGYPWIGAIGTGTDSSGQAQTFGRYPDGADTNKNNADFAVMKASPGAANGLAVSNTAPTTYDFTSAPGSAFLTFNSASAGSVTSGVGVAPAPAGGKVYRTVDATGGGQMAFIGDAALGTSAGGYSASGFVYLPGTGDPAQAIGLGICGRQGTNFFTTAKASQDSSAYESGYWLIFENKAGVGLADGRADHGSAFEFVQATHDNQDDSPVDLLASATVASLSGVAQGAWTTFYLSIDPTANKLVAKVGGNTVYDGAIPAGGPTSGAFQVGFRENHTGAPAAAEGTWIDNLTLAPRAVSGLAADFDGDGVADSVEAGDANADSILDRYQPLVAALPSAVGGATLVIGTSAGSLASVQTQAASGPPTDTTFPLGLTSFRITGLPVSGSATITINYPNTAGLNRAYKVNGATYTQIPGAVVGPTSLTYTVQDGGALDSDGVANGTIVDPAGPAVFTATSVDDWMLLN